MLGILGKSHNQETCITEEKEITSAQLINTTVTSTGSAKTFQKKGGKKKQIQMRA